MPPCGGTAAQAAAHTATTPNSPFDPQAPAALARRDTTHVLKRNDETAYAEAKIKMDCVLAGGKGRGASRGGRATGAGAAAPAPKARTSAAAPVTR